MRLSIQGLSLGYGRLTAVDDVSLDIESGDMVSIVGPNGSGKSTLLRGIGRLQRPTRGRVLLGETDIRSLGARQVARQLAVLPQSPDGGADLTVRELVYRGRFPHQGILQRLTRADVEAVDWAMKAADVELLAARTLAGAMLLCVGFAASAALAPNAEPAKPADPTPADTKPADIINGRAKRMSGPGPQSECHHWLNFSDC